MVRMAHNAQRHYINVKLPTNIAAQWTVLSHLPIWKWNHATTKNKDSMLWTITAKFCYDPKIVGVKFSKN